MMKNFKRGTLGFAVISVLIAAALLTSSTVAFLYAVSEEKVNTFYRAVIPCQVVETFENNQKSEIAIKNNGYTDSYIRVELISYFQNSAGNIIATAAEVPDFLLSDLWVLGADGYYYYTKPVAPDGLTTNMLADGEVITLTVDENGNSQVIEIFAQAVQANPTDAVIYAWGVEENSVVRAVSDDGTLSIQDGVYGNFTANTLYKGDSGLNVNYDGYTSPYENIAQQWGDGSFGSIADATSFFTSWHIGVLNDGDVPTLASGKQTKKIVEFWDANEDGYSYIYFKLDRSIDVKKVVVYADDRIDGASTDNANLGTDKTGNRGYPTSIEVLVGTVDDQDNVNGSVSLGTALYDSSAVYAKCTDGYVKEFTVDTDKAYEALSGNCVVLKIAMSSVVTLGEVQIFGYGDEDYLPNKPQVLVNENVALGAEYRGGQYTVCNTNQYLKDTYAAGSTGNTWRAYHSGKLNDGVRSTGTLYNEGTWVEFILSSADNIAVGDSGYYNIIFKLEEPSDVYTVSMYMHDSGNAARSFPDTVDVYLSDDDSWESTDTYFGRMSYSSFNDYSRLYSATGTATNTAYVVLRFYNSSAYQINAASEVEIWAQEWVDQ